MDIWLLAVLIAWLPVSIALALLVGRSLAHAERRERVLHKPRAGHRAPVVTITTAPRHPHVHVQHGHAHSARRHDDQRLAS
ncbi:MAG: hypothetical protein PGN11_03325 [Quadrisphaera sp.]